MSKNEMQKKIWDSKLRYETDLQLPDLPDLQVLKNQRIQRNKDFFKKLDQTSGEWFKSPQSSALSIEDEAAIRIQKVFRGYLGRKQYLDVLYQNVLLGEEKLIKQQQAQVLEGEILVENYFMERDLEDENQVSENKTRFLHSNASLIQRAWREHSYTVKIKQKDHICCSCNDDYPDLYEYYSKTSTVCFCCEQHRLNPDPEQFLQNKLNSCLPEDKHWMLDADEKGTKNYLQPPNDVKLTFVESYESDVSKPEVEIFNEFDDYVDIKLESVVNVPKNRSPDELDPDVEATRILKSLEIHKEHEEKPKEITCSHYSIKELECLSISELIDIVDKLNYEISLKNVKLVEELMVRDDLHSQHEALLMEAHDLERK